MNKRISGIAAISFIFSIAGIIISALLLKEDVISTAHTIFEYFPNRFGVTPSSTWEGAIILGVFTTVLQVVAANVAFSNKFGWNTRGVAIVSLIASLTFDNWTDVVFRSGNMTGNMPVAIATTIAFYTLGSEITQGLSWLVLVVVWRAAISDIMWGAAKFSAGVGSIGSEWSRFRKAAIRKEFVPDNEQKPYVPQHKPVWSGKPAQEVKKPLIFIPPTNNNPNKHRKPD